MASLCNLSHHISINPDSDMYLFSSMIKMLDAAVGDEVLKTKDMVCCYFFTLVTLCNVKN